MFWLRSNRHSQKQPGPGDTQKMSTDKLQALRNAFTEIVSEPPLPAISFDEEAATATLSSAANTAEPGELAVGDSPTGPKHLATPADQAKSFAGLGIDMMRKTVSEILNEAPSPASCVDKELAPASLVDEPIMEEPRALSTPRPTQKLR